jgi:hypothetical protein
VILTRGELDYGGQPVVVTTGWNRSSREDEAAGKKWEVMANKYSGGRREKTQFPDFRTP